MNAKESTCCYLVPGLGAGGRRECGKPATDVLRRGGKEWHYCATHGSWVKQDGRGKLDIRPIGT